LLSFFIFHSPSFAQIDWIEHTIAQNVDYANSVYAADMDGDGDMDVLGTSAYNDDITWWENLDSIGLTWSEHTVDGEFEYATCVYALDVDSDGDMDVLGSASGDDDIVWWENLNGEGLNWSRHPVDEDFNGASSVCAADVDGDGDIDVLGAATSADEIRWWENLDGVGQSWSEHLVQGEFDYAFSVHAADVDGDGDIDVLGAAGFADDITWWENLEGTGLSWSEHTVDGEFDYATSVYAADVDGDGDFDVLGTGAYEDAVTWWENLDGTGLNWSEHTVESEFDNAKSVYASDLDGDGDIDVLAVATNIDDVRWWENLDGTGLNWSGHMIDSSFDAAFSVYAADMDGDGDLDVLAAAIEADEITWWEQIPADFVLTLTSYNSTLPETGGQLFFSATITNFTDSWQVATAWSEVLLPNGVIISPLALANITLPVGTLETPILSQIVPANAPAGDYVFTVNLGAYYQDIVVASDSFNVVKTGFGSSQWTTWEASPLVFSSDNAELGGYAKPEMFELLPTYPNPFNPLTTLSVNLPEMTELSVTVYNITCQEVAELANGSFNAGTHRFTFDASDLASGLYFVRATVPGQLDQSQKVMLVR